MYRYLIYFIVFQLLSKKIYAQEFSKCITPTDLEGNCINIRDCPDLLDILYKIKQNAVYRQLLQESQCGRTRNRDVLVCCPGSKSSPIMQQQTYELPSPPVCGLSSPGVTWPRIVGGFDVNAGQFPWLVALGYSEQRSNPKWLCGGTIITQRHILSAAHCVRNDLYIVRYGTLNIYTDPNPKDVLIEEARPHKEYDKTYISNDISIIKVAEDIIFSDTPYVRPICLPVNPPLRTELFERRFPFVAGWGSLYFNGPSSDRLQGLQLPVVTNAQCKSKYASFKTAVIDNRVICAGFRAGKKDSCQGDSGGPLMVPINNDNGRAFLYQIGVISYGYKCAEPEFPGVLVRVTQYIDWIQNQLY